MVEAPVALVVLAAAALELATVPSASPERPPDAWLTFSLLLLAL